jgi:probable rRNA maturation factor
MKPICSIEIVLNCAGWSRHCPAAERLAGEAARLALREGAAALELAPAAPVELGIILSDADEQLRLNRDYRGQDVPTNVLAFPAWDQVSYMTPDIPILLGDVVLAFEIIAREAAEQQKSIDAHLSHLVVHGVLHLLGFDHMTATDAERMESLETSILAKLGIADPYREAACSPDAGSTCHE